MRRKMMFLLSIVGTILASFSSDGPKEATAGPVAASASWPPQNLHRKPGPVPRPAPGPIDCNTTQNPLEQKACCAHGNGRYWYCAQVTNKICEDQACPGWYVPWDIGGGVIICCPPGQIPTGNRVPDRVCVLPSQVGRPPAYSPLNTGGLQGSVAWPVVQGIIQGHIGLMACMDDVDIFCLANFAGSPIQLKRCIESGYLDCLEMAGVCVN